MWQPWASLWVAGPKVHETRGRRFNYRGWLAVCAAQRPPDNVRDTDPRLEEICVRQFGADWRQTIPLGKVVGAVLVRDCYHATFPNKPVSDDDEVCGYWGSNRYAILREHALRLDFLKPQKGMQSVVFDIDPDIEAEIMAAIDARGWPLGV